jgi:hypothetical protein
MRAKHQPEVTEIAALRLDIPSLGAVMVLVQPHLGNA